MTDTPIYDDLLIEQFEADCCAANPLADPEDAVMVEWFKAIHGMGATKWFPDDLYTRMRNE